MADGIAGIIERLSIDEWRVANGFTDELEVAQRELFENADRPAEQARVLNNWIQKHQPCLFGRAAASQGTLHYCILNASDFAAGDDAVRARISESHLQWTRDAFQGHSSGFIVAAVDPRIAKAKPNADVLALAKRFAALYLLEDDVQTDRIYHDAVYLAVPGHSERVFKWRAGVNYFSAHADKRWWQDHRIPGGLAFSTNSVGHLVKSGNVLSALNDYLIQVGLAEDQQNASKIDSLSKALTIAMQTIDNASEAISGKATRLLPASSDRNESSYCPFKLPAKLQDKSVCSYRGYYHTDYTLPSEYFRADIERPSDIQPYDNLDFTYLFRKSADNPAHFTMGEGVPIRGEDDEDGDWMGKIESMIPDERSAKDEPRLARALGLG